MITIERPNLTDYQREYLYHPARFTIVEAGTKTGKTYSHMWWAFELWHNEEMPVGWEVWWVAPVYPQAKIAFNRIRRAIKDSPGYEFNIAELSITNPIGRLWRFKSAEKPHNLYGENVAGWVFDEFTRARPDALTALRSTLTHTRGKGKMIGNYIGESNWGHQLALSHASDKEWAYFKVPATKAVQAGILEQDEVDQAQRDLPSWQFMALYMCQGSADPLQMIRPEAINDLWTNTVEDGDRCITADIAGHGRDKTVIGRWCGMRLEEVHVMEDSPLPKVLASIETIKKVHRVKASNIAIDTTGVGSGLGDMIQGVYRFEGAGKVIDTKKTGVSFGNLRAQCYYTLADMVNAGDIAISPACDAIREHLGVELEFVKRRDDVTDGKLYIIKKEEVKAALNRSPDYADMMMMRMALHLKGLAGVGTEALRNKGRRYRRDAFREAVTNTFGS